MNSPFSDSSTGAYAVPERCPLRIHCPASVSKSIICLGRAQTISNAAALNSALFSKDSGDIAAVRCCAQTTDGNRNRASIVRRFIKAVF